MHYWTSRFVIVNTVLLSVLEGCALWRLCVGAEIRYTWARTGPESMIVIVQNQQIRSRICVFALFRSLPNKMWSHVWKMLSQGFAFAVLWPFIPQFVCNCLFYWALYLSPIINIDLVVRHLMHPETQALWRQHCQAAFVTPRSPQQMYKVVFQRRVFDWLVCWLPWISVGWSPCGPSPQQASEMMFWPPDCCFIWCRSTMDKLASKGGTKWGQIICFYF